MCLFKFIVKIGGSICVSWIFFILLYCLQGICRSVALWHGRSAGHCGVV